MPRSALTGSRIRERRLVLGLRQVDLARAVAISPSYLNLIEHNRRRIGGKLLVDLARRLDVEASVLSEGAEAALMDTLREAAAGHAVAKGELPRIEEFVNRFPGWARLLSDRHSRVGELERVVERLTDRMTHDPFLSASMHEVLSTVTAIRSTAAILTNTEDLDPGWQARFHRNLRDDSHRLAEGAQALVNYLDDSTGKADRQGTPREEVAAFLEARDFHVAELETPAGDIAALIESAEELSSAPARALARAYLERYRQDAAQMPLVPFAEAARGAQFDPGVLGQGFGADPGAVFRRLATLPAALAPVKFGLVVCDGSGAPTYRKPLAGFGLPRFGAGCPLWPLYQALSRPMAPIRAQVEQTNHPPQRFLTFAFCQPTRIGNFGGPQVLEASMLILADPDTSAGAAQPIGTSCRICPRAGCPARREPSILADGF